MVEHVHIVHQREEQEKDPKRLNHMLKKVILMNKEIMLFLGENVKNQRKTKDPEEDEGEVGLLHQRKKVLILQQRLLFPHHPQLFLLLVRLLLVRLLLMRLMSLLDPVKYQFVLMFPFVETHII